jgi:hypothetical protein
MAQKLKFGGTKMGRLMKRLVSIKDIPAQSVLEIYWKTTVDYAVYIISKHDTGKKLSQKEQGIIDFIETIVCRIEALKGGEIADDRQAAISPDPCRQESVGIK